MADSLLQDEPDPAYEPLAARMRPRTLDEFVGQDHILAPGKPLFQAIQSANMHSMILWGPPGVGKTTLARIIANTTNSHFESLSAVLAGIKDIREAIERAAYHRNTGQGKRTLLFVDEVHRFNKSQQDAFLPHIENGTITFIGATTENPAFELNNALLSRARVYVLKNLTQAQLLDLLGRALGDRDRGLGNLGLNVDEAARLALAQAADGDGRRLLNLLEVAADLAEEREGIPHIAAETVAQVTQESLHRFDKGGDYFYDQISALHKAVRGTSPDAALYWFTRMLDAGCDPLYIARRMLRMASEDIGNADPRALQLAQSGWDAYLRLGSPEGELALAQVLLYLACAPKSNAVYTAFGEARATVSNSGSLEVPLHLRNAPTGLAKELGHGQEYRYAHDESGAYAAGENYFPESLKDCRFYRPVDAGLESRIREKLKHLSESDRNSANRRYRD